MPSSDLFYLYVLNMLSCETQTQKEKTTVVKINGNYEMYYEKANYALL